MTNDLSTRMDALFSEFDEPGAPGASVMVIRNGRPIFGKGYGLANVESGVRCDTNNNFRLASVTKQFTATAILKLWEQKRLSLDESLMDFFPEFPAYGRGITVRHLLTHTSGLVDYEDVIPAGTTLPVLDRDVLRLLMGQTKTYFAPGKTFRYSNSAYALLALIVEVRSGQTFASFLRDEIFRPLRMNGTLAYESGSSQVTQRAFGYTLEEGKFVASDQSLTSSVLGDGGIYSSVSDLARLDASWYGDKLLRDKTRALAMTAGTHADQKGRHYGFGWYVGEYRGLKEVWHSGSTRGFTTRIARFPDKRFTVIILTNRSGAKIDDLPHQIADWCLFGTD